MRPRRQQPTRLPRPWDSPGKNWSGKVAQLCPVLWDPMDYTVNGNLQARKLEWVAVSFSRRSSQPRDWTKVSWIAGGFFTNWAIRETCILNYFILKICHMKILRYWSIWNWGGLILLLWWVSLIPNGREVSFKPPPRGRRWKWGRDEQRTEQEQEQGQSLFTCLDVNLGKNKIHSFIWVIRHRQTFKSLSK